MFGLRNRRKRWMGLLLANLGLLALFGWALTETTTLQIAVRNGECTAMLGERTSSVPCPGLDGGEIGVYNAADVDPQSIARDPWRRIVPSSSWRTLTVAQHDGSGAVPLLVAGRAKDANSRIGQWRTALGELRATSGRAALQWANPLPADFVLEGTLRRPGSGAGLLLLQPNGEDGWLFLYNSSTRLGTWWRWQEGRALEPLLGAPLQKSLAAQSQSLLRTILLGHQAGLLLLLASWLLALLLAWAARRLQRSASGPPEPGADAAQRSGEWAGMRRRIMLVSLLLWVFAWSLFIGSDLLGGIPHVQDSITYRFQAQTLARGRLAAPAPPEPAAFEQEFMLVQDGRWFGKYPPGYPLLLAIGELLGLASLVNPLLATLSVALIFTLGAHWYRQSVGLLAAFLAAISPFFLITSGNFMAHAAELFWVLLFMVSWTRVVRKPASSAKENWLWLVGAGVALGMIFLTRQLTALAIAGPFALATSVGRTGDVSWPRRIKDLLGLAVVAAPLAALLLVYQAAVTGDPFKDPRLLFWSYDHLGFGQDIGQGQNVVTYDRVEGEPILVWQHDPAQPPRGHSPARGVFNVERNWQHLQSHLFGWLPAFTLAFAWLVFVLGRARPAD
ncbi:MAG: glycosyltransferase family 39 protein, partial [Chloroflexota bacterium]